MMDIRHPLKNFDLQMLGWAKQAELPIHILLTKSDKLGRGAGGNALQQVRKELKEAGLNASVQLFSSLNHQGRDEAIQVLDEWFELSTPAQD